MSQAAPVQAAFSYLNRILDQILPHRCAACGEETVSPGLCGRCFAGLTPIAGSQCTVCGLPFELPQPEDTRCAACIADPPAFDAARSALVYDDASRDLILALKHADRTDLAPILSGHLARAAERMRCEPVLILPVPLHRRRLLHRRYNQSALLARHLGKRLSLPVKLDWLKRVRATPSQGGLGQAQRQRNVAGAFRLRGRKRLSGRAVLLVDDVFTTGATVEACSRVLRRAGAKWIGVVTVARVVSPRTPGL